MLFFIDETWQQIDGTEVGALGAVGIPRARYNAFCRKMWAIKHNVLGANRLDETEIKGNSCFAKSAFRKREATGHSRLLQAAEETLEAVQRCHGHAFAVWTTHEEWMLLRHPNPETASRLYVELLRDFRRLMRRCEGTGRQGMLFFDNRGRSEDIGAASAIQNFLARVDPEWGRRFMQVPHFTVSAVSPGLQTADLIAYLAAHQHDPTVRPELAPYWERVEGIAFRGQRVALRPINAE